MMTFLVLILFISVVNRKKKRKMKTLKNQLKMMIISFCLINVACNNAQNSEFGFEESPYSDESYYEYMEEMGWNEDNENTYPSEPMQDFQMGNGRDNNFQNQPYQSSSLNTQEANFNGAYGYQNNRTQGRPMSPQQGGLKMMPSINPQNGQPECYIPLPDGWRVDFTTWSGPNGQTVKFLGTQTFNGQQKQFRNIDDLIEREIKPQMLSNFRLDRVIPLKEVAMKDASVQAKFYKYAPSNDISAVSGLEATNMDNGDKAFLTVHFLTCQSQVGTVYSYRLRLLECKARDFESSKAIMINALCNFQENDQMIAMQNQQQKAQLAANDRAYQTKMKGRWDSFNASQARAKANSDMMDSSYKSYMDRSRANDLGHSRGVDAILGQETTTNPFDGREVKMESGYDHYYMNTWGEYIGTNDNFYDPNMDPSRNNQQWKKVNPR